MLRYVAFKCCDRLVGACKSWANNVGICYVEMLLSFSQGFMQHPQMLHKKIAHFQIWAKNTQHLGACRNPSQQGGQTCATCCSQQYWDMLRSFGRNLISAEKGCDNPQPRSQGLSSSLRTEWDCNIGMRDRKCVTGRYRQKRKWHTR